MTLPFDYARCAGTTHPTCGHCRRREPGREAWQTYIAPPIMLSGWCSEFIEPMPTLTASSTAEIGRATAKG